jgi:hypothetical protein
MRRYTLKNQNWLDFTALAGWLGWPGLAGGWEGLAGLGWAELGLAGLGWAGCLAGWLVVWLIVWWLAGGRNPSIRRYLEEGYIIHGNIFMAQVQLCVRYLRDCHVRWGSLLVFV